MKKQRKHLKDQAKNLLKAGGVKSLTEAQFQIARLYGFASWPKLKAHVDLLEETGQLKQAIDTNNLDTVKTLMTRSPMLHRAPLGYAKKWATHLGCGTPRAVGTAQSREAGNGGVDDRSRIRRPPGWRWTPNAGSARRSHCDDGTSRFPRSRCERFMERALPHPVRRLRSC
jgi:hypothetical protein